MRTYSDIAMLPTDRGGTARWFLVFVLVMAFSSVDCVRKTTTQETLSHPPSTSQASLPQPNGFVNDFANVFDVEARKRLEAAVQALRREADVEFAIATVETTNNQSMFDYSLALARAWKPGGQSGRGLLLVLAIKDRQWRLQVSKALEKELPDDVCKTLAEPSVELYKRGKYEEGVAAYIAAIRSQLKN